MTTIPEVRKLLTEKRVILGTDRTIKALRQGALVKVLVSSNCPPALKRDIQRYCQLTNAAMEEMSQTNEALGVVCKKPFLISVIGVLKSA